MNARDTPGAQQDRTQRTAHRGQNRTCARVGRVMDDVADRRVLGDALAYSSATGTSCHILFEDFPLQQWTALRCPHCSSDRPVQIDAAGQAVSNSSFRPANSEMLRPTLRYRSPAW